MRGWPRWPPLVLAVLLAGCASQVIRVEPPASSGPLALPDLLVAPVPLRVGVLVTPAQRDYAFRDRLLSVGLAGDRLEVGAATEAALLRALRAGFTEVVAEPPPLDAPAAQARIEIAELEWTTTLEADAYRLGARLKLRLLEPGGAEIGTWAGDVVVDVTEITREAGVWQTVRAGSPWRAPAALVLERLESAVALGLRDAPAIRAWLEARGGYVPAMPPLDAAASAGIPTPPGLLVVSDADSAPVAHCVADALHTRLPALPQANWRSGRLALHPWLAEVERADATIGRLAALLQVPAARARLAAAGVGRFVVVSGGTRQEWRGGILCGGGYGGGGCLGLAWGDRDTVIVARIVDPASGAAPATHGAERHGKAVVPAFLLPLPFIPATQTAACNALADDLARALGGESRR